jgi:hypothetical protein
VRQERDSLLMRRDTEQVVDRAQQFRQGALELERAS